MFDFEREQKSYDIYGVTVGGLPGENPTVMIGSLFYSGQKIVKNGKDGVFDQEQAETIINEVEEQTDKTGLPSMIDLVAETTKAAERYLDFTVEKTEMPILLDCPSEKVHMESLQYANDQGIMERIVVNSLTPHTKGEVYQKIREVNCESAVLLLYSTQAILSSDKRSVVEKLVPKAEEAGIKNILVDTVVLDIPTLGLATKAIYQIKNQYGYPTGCGAHNAIDTWKGLKKKFVKKAATVSLGVANGLPVALGADFVLYGPMENAKYIYPSIALIDVAYSQLLMEKGKKVGKGHPIYKIG